MDNLQIATDLVDVLARRCRIFGKVLEGPPEDYYLLHTVAEDMLFTAQTLVDEFCIEDAPWTNPLRK